MARPASLSNRHFSSAPAYNTQGIPDFLQCCPKTMLDTSWTSARIPDVTQQYSFTFSPIIKSINTQRNKRPSCVLPATSVTTLNNTCIYSRNNNGQLLNYCSYLSSHSYFNAMIQYFSVSRSEAHHPVFLNILCSYFFVASNNQCNVFLHAYNNNNSHKSNSYHS